jgi:hypothetical protein
MAQVVALVSDLMLSSRVAEMLGSAGHDVTVKSVPDAETAAADLIVADLEAVDAEAVGSLEPPTLGFYSHVDVETRRAAEAAGFDLVVPRSRMARELPALAERLLSG